MDILAILAGVIGLSLAGSAQAVTPNGTSAWTPAFPFTIRGVLLCNPDEMLDSTPRFSVNPAGMGGEWQITFQTVESGDRGGTTCWMGQNYANRVPPNDDEFSYANPDRHPELGTTVSDYSRYVVGRYCRGGRASPKGQGP